MNTQTILITGATDGVGKLVALNLAKQNPHLLLHGRNEEKLYKVIDEIKSLTNNKNIEGFVADFSSMDEVSQMAKDVLAKHKTIDVLINNAGAGFAAPRYGKDGTETAPCRKLSCAIFTYQPIIACNKKSIAFAHSKCKFSRTITDQF